MCTLDVWTLARLPETVKTNEPALGTVDELGSSQWCACDSLLVEVPCETYTTRASRENIVTVLRMRFGNA